MEQPEKRKDFYFDASMIPEETTAEIEKFNLPDFWRDEAKAREALKKEKSLSNGVWDGLMVLLREITENEKDETRKKRIKAYIDKCQSMVDIIESIFALKTMAGVLGVTKDGLNPLQLLKEAYVAEAQARLEAGLPPHHELPLIYKPGEETDKKAEEPAYETIVKNLDEEFELVEDDRIRLKKADELLQELMKDPSLRDSYHDWQLELEINKSHGKFPRKPPKKESL